MLDVDPSCVKASKVANRLFKTWWCYADSGGWASILHGTYCYRSPQAVR